MDFDELSDDMGILLERHMKKAGIEWESPNNEIAAKIEQAIDTLLLDMIPDEWWEEY